MSSQPIVIYATTWCSDCKRSRRLLDQLGASYTYIDIEHDEQAAQYVEQVNGGNRSVPTIQFADGSVLVEPSNAVLQQKLQSLGVIAG
jgi:mycoredoxin